MSWVTNFINNALPVFIVLGFLAALCCLCGCWQLAARFAQSCCKCGFFCCDFSASTAQRVATTATADLGEKSGTNDSRSKSNATAPAVSNKAPAVAATKPDALGGECQYIVACVTCCYCCNMLKPAPDRVAQPVTSGQQPKPDPVATRVEKPSEESAAESLPLLSLDSVMVRP